MTNWKALMRVYISAKWSHLNTRKGEGEERATAEGG